VGRNIQREGAPSVSKLSPGKKRGAGQRRRTGGGTETQITHVFETKLLLVCDGDGRVDGVVGDGRGRGRLLRGSERHPPCGLSYRHWRVAAGGRGKGARRGVSEGGVCAVERSERPLDGPRSGKVSLSLALVVIPRNETSLSPFSLGVGPTSLSEPPSDCTRFSRGALYLSAASCEPNRCHACLAKLRSLGLSYINGAALLPRTQQPKYGTAYLPLQPTVGVKGLPCQCGASSGVISLMRKMTSD
jgi:hypothetical protein